MPSRKDTIQFIKDNDLTLKGYSKLNIAELNSRVESVVDGEVKKRWNRLKIKTESSPMTSEKTRKLVRKEQLKQGTPKKIQATTIEGEIANLLAASDRLEAEANKLKKKKDSEKTRRFKEGIEREKRERAKRDEERRKEAEERQKRIEARKKNDELQKKKQKKKKKKKSTDK